MGNIENGTAVQWDRSGWRRPGGMPCVVCREVVVGAVCATVHATDDYLRWASSHCARTPATANGNLARPPDPTLAQPKPAQRTYGNGLHKQGGAGREIRFNIAGVERGGDDPLITIYTAIRAQTPLSHCPVMSVPRTSSGALLVVCRLWDLQIYSACRACQSRVRVAQASL